MGQDGILPPIVNRRSAAREQPAARKQLPVTLNRLSRYFRRRRMAAFARRMKITPATSILDIGGTPDSGTSSSRSRA